MGEKVLDSPNVQEMFKIAKRILGYDLLELCLNGPQSKLDRTEYCQPAMFVTSLAALEKLRAEKEKAAENCVATAGFSVGEFAALVFAGAISFEDALRLIKIRAEAMQAASELVPSGLMTILYGADGKINFACQAAREWCVRKGIHEDYAVCSVANYLFPHCKVIGGHKEALNFIEMNARDFGIKRCRRLPVSGAFHTKLMKPAEDVFKEALKKVAIQKPLIAVYSNVDARTYNSEATLREKLGKQICSPVKFEQIFHTIYERDPQSEYPFTFECGPGTSIMTLLGQVNGRARRQALSISA
jgi:[acyl-carrier-protein] S-malonyltransferase